MCLGFSATTDAAASVATQVLDLQREAMRRENTGQMPGGDPVLHHTWGMYKKSSVVLVFTSEHMEIFYGFVVSECEYHTLRLWWFWKP